MNNIKRKRQLFITYKKLEQTRKTAELHELHIRNILEKQRDESVRKFKEKFGKYLKNQNSENIV